eukprot:TRINITY_DN1606_c0_g4_i1.p1 TRINITY_DN1606_c0_g4~~TRINITY_DN1606_c0_g4_i1.p1  ORF type:complete len:228 (-),score=39.18 TRINITY_DN1606_c0_g4_i1:212-895(-)
MRRIDTPPVLGLSSDVHDGDDWPIQRLNFLAMLRVMRDVQDPASVGVVSFQVQKETSWGDVVKLVGSSQQFGAWDVNKGLHLRTYKGLYPLWRLDVAVCFEPNLEFKFIYISSDGTVEWEPFEGNRRLEMGVTSVNAMFGKLRFKHRELEEELTCAVCLSEIQDDETSWQCWKCGNALHDTMECARTWLQKHRSCPSCRTSTLTWPPEEGRWPAAISVRWQVLQAST